jgi:heme A synthase
MVRIVFTYIVPFLLPLAVYLAWGWYRTRYVAAHGGEPPKLERGPWPLLLVLGAMLTLLSLAATALTRGSDAGSAYTPSHLENGQLVPGHMDAKPH